MICMIALSILPIQRIQSLEIPLVSGWELADGSVILNEDQLWEAASIPGRSTIHDSLLHSLH
jgi:hypothetical protein